jgi:hypothetical protein
MLLRQLDQLERVGGGFNAYQFLLGKVAQGDLGAHDHGDWNRQQQQRDDGDERELVRQLEVANERFHDRSSV